MSISKERALELIGIYLARDLSVADLRDGWHTEIYGGSEDLVWSIAIPPDQPRVGSEKFVVISKLTGKILADYDVGE